MMRRIILSINITEDGFIAGPNGELDWHFPFWNLEMSEALCRLLHKADTILLGRKTYSALAGYWAYNTNNMTMAREDIVLAEIMNRHAKVVVSKTLRLLPWINSSSVRGSVVKEINKLKQMQGKDIVVLGSGTLVTYLIKHNLVDEYNLWIHPITIKSGIRVAKLDNSKSERESSYTERFATGVRRVCYSTDYKDLISDRSNLSKIK